MALKWIYGNFQTGEISENNVLPVLVGDEAIRDINGGDTARFNVSKRDLERTDWTEYLRRLATMVALVDDSKNWNDEGAVLWAGFVNKMNGKPREAITIYAAGFREYLAAKGVVPYLNGSSVRPSDGFVFSADTWQGVVKEVIEHAFSLPTDPKLLGNIDGNSEGSAKQLPVLLSDTAKYAEVLDAIRDDAAYSPNGTEYKFVPRWDTSQKQKIVFDVKIGEDEKGKLNWDGTNYEIYLLSDAFNSLDYSLSLTSENVANRIIGISKSGDVETNTGMDYTVKSVDNGLPTTDFYFLPGVELTAQEMDEQLTARLADLKNSKGTAEYSLKADAVEAFKYLGARITFWGSPGTDTEGYDTVVRCTAVRFSASNQEVTLDIMLPQPRYPRLPSSSKRSDLGNAGGFGPGQGNGFNGVPSGGIQNPLPGPGGAIEIPDITPPELPTTPEDEFHPYKNAAGSQFSLAINADGELFGWGANYSYATGTVDTPNDITYPAKVGEATNWQAVYAGASTGYGLNADGELFGWGENGNGEVGTGSAGSAVRGPTKILENVKEVYTNLPSTTFAITKDNKLFSWGRNAVGQLGQGLPATDNSFNANPTQIDGEWAAVSASSVIGFDGLATVLGLKTDGTVWQWGICKGESGDIKRSNPKKVSPEGSTYGKVFTPTPYVAFAIQGDGSVWTWGLGYWNGDNGTSVNRPEFAKYYFIDNVSNFPQASHQSNNSVDIALDNAPFSYGLHFVKTDGTLWALGNSRGSAGIGSTNEAVNIPKKVGEDTDWAEAFWRRGPDNNYVIKKNGRLYVWGLNISGALGVGNSIIIPDVRPVGEDTDWVRVAVSPSFFAIATKDKDLHVTGSNGSGQLGLNDKSARSSWTRQE